MFFVLKNMSSRKLQTKAVLGDWFCNTDTTLQDPPFAFIFGDN